MPSPKFAESTYRWGPDGYSLRESLSYRRGSFSTDGSCYPHPQKAEISRLQGRDEFYPKTAFLCSPPGSDRNSRVFCPPKPLRQRLPSFRSLFQRFLSIFLP